MTHVKFNRKPFEGSFNNLIDDLFNELPVLPKNDCWVGMVPVNIKEMDKNFIIEVIAPGFDKSEFNISLDQQLLTISAEKKNKVKEDQENIGTEKQIRKEYSFRTFKRSFTLDDKTDGTNIDAKYVNGILTLNLPRKEEVKPSIKEITIQ